jgi:branched-chain amino acid transport system ATP-binding protein
VNFLLRVEALYAGYGDVIVLEDVSLDIAEGEMISVVGANGAGKTTLLSTICGLVRARSGQIMFKGVNVTGTPAHELTERGLAMVPEGGRLFPFMTVRENLELGAYVKSARQATAERMRDVMELFPILSERRDQLAGQLSGGERQMCAIARAIMSRPSLLLLDEPSVGLSPLMVERVFEIVQKLAREEGLTIVLVEQNVAEALEVASRAYVLDHGRIVQQGPAAALRDDRQIQGTYMGL